MNHTSIFGRNYKERICSVCGASYKPKGPREKRCANCLGLSCVDCGSVISAHLKRLIKNKVRRCAACHAKPHGLLGSGHPVPVGTKRQNAKAGGYIEVKTEEGWQLEHRAVMARKLGRVLLPSEIVHHKDEDRTNNDPDNLTPDLRTHLETHHKHELKNPPRHHFGNKKWGPEEYAIWEQQKGATA